MSAVRRTLTAAALLVSCAAPAAAAGEPNFGASNLPTVHVREGSRIDEQIDLGRCPDAFVCRLTLRGVDSGRARPGSDFTLTTTVATSAPYERPPLRGVATFVARDDGRREGSESTMVEAHVEYMRADPQTPYLCAERGCPVESTWRWVGIVVIDDRPVSLAGQRRPLIQRATTGPRWLPGGAPVGGTPR